MNILDRVHVTIHGSGKLDGMTSISTSSLDNGFCKSMRKVDGSICQDCYACRFEKFRPNMRKKYQNNARILRQYMGWDDIPYINARHCRLDAFGELHDKEHMWNYIQICDKNPCTTFTLWTKRDNIVNSVLDCYSKPDNLILIYSSKMKNKRHHEMPRYFDKMFTVYTRDYAKKNGVHVICKGNCFDCMICYKHNNTKYVSELKK